MDQLSVLTNAFHDRLIEAATISTEKLHYRPSYFLQMLVE
jgi:hypothetical protein